MAIVVQSTVPTQPGAYTFLGLVQRLAVLAGAPGSTGYGPNTCQNQKGEAARFVNWINDAWLDIQTMHQDWGWLRTNASLQTVEHQAIYPFSQISNAAGVVGLTDFGMWDKKTGRNYVTEIGTLSEIFMDYIDYEDWRDQYSYGALRNTTSQPIQFAINPADHSICLAPYPNAGYTFTCDYFRSPSELVNDTDVPAMPAQYQLAIVYKAMQLYGDYEKDQGVIDSNTKKANRLIRRCEIDWVPQLRTAGALA